MTRQLIMARQPKILTGFAVQLRRMEYESLRSWPTVPALRRQQRTGKFDRLAPS